MMNKLACVLVALTACGVDSVPGSTGGGGTQPTGTGSDTGTLVSGPIAQDATWSGTVTVTDDVTVNAGVTLTVASGTTVYVKSGIDINVSGTLDAQGASGSQVTFEPASGATNFGSSEDGIIIASGATLNMTYVTLTGSGILLEGTSSAKIRDSQMSKSSHDLLVIGGEATLDMQYSSIGLQPGQGDTTHCDMHFAAGTITVSHSNVSTSAYGIMFYGGNNANFTYDTWFSNDTNIDMTPGEVSGDFSNSYFDKNPPAAMTGITFNNPASAKLPACDGTNDSSCSGPHS